MVDQRSLKLVKEHLDKWRGSLFAEYSKQRKASGSFGNSLKTEMNDNGGSIIGNRYIGSMVYGRRPTTGSGDGSLQKKIYDWIKDKGIKYKNDKERVSISYAISKHIHKYGIKVPNKNNDGKLLENSITPQDKLKLQQEVGYFYLSKFTTEIKNTWQQV